MKLVHSERLPSSRWPASSSANSASHAASDSASSIASKPSARQVCSGHSTIQVLVRSSNGYACTWTSPSPVSLKMNVNASSTRSVPNQANLQPCGSTRAPKRSASVRRTRLLTPSAPTTRSASAAISARSPTSAPKRRSTPSSRARSLQDPQQLLARDRRERVAARAQQPAAVADVDGRPARERVGDPQVRLGVGVAQRAERLLREHDAPAERRVGRVALEHGDVVPRVRLRQQDRQLEPRGPGADDPDLHASTSARRSTCAGSATVGNRISSSQPASA